jgi:hypothetical protein
MRTGNRWAACLILPLLMVIAGCETRRTVTKQAQGIPMVSGRAMVVEVNPRLGMAVLDMRGKQFDAYWKPEVIVSHNGTYVPPKTMFDPPVGVYQETTAVPTAFPAKPGDMIEFLGMRSGDDILLQRVAVVPKS